MNKDEMGEKCSANMVDEKHSIYLLDTLKGRVSVGV
jgi:hypothetical protein